MKTITGMVIYSHVETRGWKRSANGRQLHRDMFRALGYCAVATWLSLDTGFLFRDWQFWIMFAPLLIAGEIAAWTISKVRSS